MNYTEEELNIMEAFEEEMMRIHENPLFYEDDVNLDEIEVCNSDFFISEICLDRFLHRSSDGAYREDFRSFCKCYRISTFPIYFGACSGKFE